jgi:hypothetical protein
MGIPENELDLTYDVFLPIIQNWLQNFNFYLKETNKKTDDPLQQTSEKVTLNIFAKALDQRKIELDELSIKYNHSAIHSMEQQTQYNKAVVLFAPGQSTTLTTAKVHQMLSTKEHIILNLRQVIRYKTGYNCLETQV